MIRSGFLPDDTVAEALARVLPLCDDSDRIVIRAIDSGRREHVEVALQVHRVPYEVHHGNVSVAIGAVQSRLEQLFTGFDEVWLFRDPLPSCELDAPDVTSDGSDFSAGVPSRVIDVIQQSGCLFVLGDGCGLNVVAMDERFASAIFGS